MEIKGIIFDMDGVVTETADLHFKAWKIIFDKFFFQINESNISFSQRDYLHYLDGIPRKNGVKNFFDAYKIPDSKIKKYYVSLAECINSICTQKNNLILSIIAENKVNVFPDFLEFMNHLSSLNYKIAIISSSKNCKKILESAGITQLFSVRIDGETSEEKNIPGKPNPGIFLEAAKQLGLLPQECMVIEDALAGVKAAKEGGFGLVVALDRKSKLFNEFKLYNPDFILKDLSKSQLNFYNKIFKNKPKILSALKALSTISSALKYKKEIIIFLDYDGTLTPIVDRPEDAHLSSVMKESIQQLCKNYLTVVISGRQLSNLKERVNISTIFYAGNHGFELEGPKNFNLSFKIGEEYFEDIQTIFKEIHSALGKIPGCIIENKKFSLSIHYRLVEEQNHQIISSTVDLFLENYKKLARHDGKKVIEIRPKIAWNKGIASLNLLKWIKKDKSNLIPLYIGDDATDEDAFEQFNSKGITIKVGACTNTHAQYFLKSPDHVKFFLDQLNGFKEKHE